MLLSWRSRLLALLVSPFVFSLLIGCNSNKGKSVPDLTKKLKDPNPGVRAQAVEDLRLLGLEQSRPAIPEIAEMLGDPDEKAARWAGECLGTFGEAAFPVLMEKARDKNPRARAMSWVGINGLGDVPVKHGKEYAKALEIALKDEDVTTRQLAAHSFYVCNALAPDAFPVVVEALENNNDQRVLCSLLAGLQALTEPQLKQIHSAIPRLRTLSKSQDQMVKNIATRLLVLMGEEKGEEDKGKDDKKKDDNKK